ncbi:RNA polymerase sigma factor [Nitrobacter vulgaris]
MPRERRSLMSWDDLHTLFVRHSKEIANALRRRGVTPENAADLTQEAFLRLLAAGRPNNAKCDNPRAFLFRASRNLHIDQIRRERHVRQVALTDAEFEAIPDGLPSPETMIFDRQRLAISAAALQELPERTRRAFEMHHLGDKGIAAVAQELGVSTTRTWVLIRGAYCHVRDRLREAEG